MARKITKIRLVLLAVVVVFLITPGRGQAVPTVYTGIDNDNDSGLTNSTNAGNQFDAVLSGPLNVITFEGFDSQPIGSSSFTVAPGVSVSYSGQYWESVTGYYSGVNDYNADSVWGKNTTAGGSKYLGMAPLPTTTTPNTASITFTFTDPINAFGGYFSGLEIFSGNTLTLNYGSYSLSFANTSIDDPAVRFFGITDTDPMTQITLTEVVPPGGGDYDWWGLDDVRYGTTATAVPEPATLLLLGSGLAALGGVAWRRHHSR